MQNVCHESFSCFVMVGHQGPTFNRLVKCYLIDRDLSISESVLRERRLELILIQA